MKRESVIRSWWWFFTVWREGNAPCSREKMRRTYRRIWVPSDTEYTLKSLLKIYSFKRLSFTSRGMKHKKFSIPLFCNLDLQLTKFFFEKLCQLIQESSSHWTVYISIVYYSILIVLYGWWWTFFKTTTTTTTKHTHAT